MRVYFLVFNRRRPIHNSVASSTHNVVYCWCLYQSSDDPQVHVDDAQQVTGVVESGMKVVGRPRGTPLIQTPATGDAAVSVQILYVDGDHWVAVSCIAGTVTVSVHR